MEYLKFAINVRDILSISTSFIVFMVCGQWPSKIETFIKWSETEVFIVYDTADMRFPYIICKDIVY